MKKIIIGLLAIAVTGCGVLPSYPPCFTPAEQAKWKAEFDKRNKDDTITDFTCKQYRK